MKDDRSHDFSHLIMVVSRSIYASSRYVLISVGIAHLVGIRARDAHGSLSSPFPFELSRQLEPRTPPLFDSSTGVISLGQMFRTSWPRCGFCLALVELNKCIKNERPRSYPWLNLRILRLSASAVMKRRGVFLCSSLYFHICFCRVAPFLCDISGASGVGMHPKVWPWPRRFDFRESLIGVPWTLP